MGVYDSKPKRLLAQLSSTFAGVPSTSSYCAGFELQVWRCDVLADHLIEWMTDYALQEDELKVHHGNMYIRLREAAARIYTSENYSTRGEVGEIALHAICRDFFETIPIAPRVFYLTSSNDVVKSFDLVHVRYIGSVPELWLGEAKFYKDSNAAINAAIDSVSMHIDQGFLINQKLLLAPQISKTVPQYEEIRSLLSTQTSLDELFLSAVFPICIACDSHAVAISRIHDLAYMNLVQSELDALAKSVASTDLVTKIKIMLIYIPLGSKESLAAAFDARLKGLLPCR